MSDKVSEGVANRTSHSGFLYRSFFVERLTARHKGETLSQVTKKRQITYKRKAIFGRTKIVRETLHHVKELNQTSANTKKDNIYQDIKFIMVTLNTRSVTMPVGIVRMVEVVLSCITFSLVASVGHNNSSYWTWCMFTWCFCCFMTLLILILEFTSLHVKVPISWDDFTTAFAMLATLMILAASVIYPTFFVCSSCSRQIAATVISCLCFIAYASEVSLTKARPGEISGFLSTVPGLMKVLEAFVACIIFISLDQVKRPPLQWCVAVYSLCFIFALLIIILTICRLLSLCPFPFDKVLTGYNVLAVIMYMTVVVIWPLYSFQDNPRPPNCNHCSWDNQVVVSFMSCVNLIVYIVDTCYSIRLVFITPV